MATIRTAIQLQDRMTPALRGITTALNVTISSFEALQRASHNTIDTASLATARRELANAEATINQVEQQIREANNAQQQFNGSVRSGGNAMDGLVNKVKNLAAAYLGAKAVQQGINATDNFINRQARLGLIVDVDDSAMDAAQQKIKATAELQNEIYRAAQRSRGEYGAMVDNVAKLGLLAGDAFNNTSEIVAFTETMQKAFKVSGASTQEATNAMYQLNQAMASGRLQGDEYRSIIENAPMLANALADYCGVTRGELKQLSSDGELTADVIKGAVFNMAKELEAQYQQMPLTFAEAWIQIKNTATRQAQDTMQRVNDALNSNIGTSAIDGIKSIIETLISGLGTAVEVAVNAAGFIANNWSQIEPIIWGICGAVIAYNGYLAISKALESESLLVRAATTLATFAQGAAMAFLGVMTGNMTLAQMGLNMALYACPLLLVAAAIGVVIYFIAQWVQSVGGLKIAWMIVSNWLLNTWESLKLGFMKFTTFCVNSFQQMSVGLSGICTGITVFFSNMKVSILEIIQNMVNGAIDMINGFIQAVNKLPGVAIDTIQHVTFAAEEKAAVEARNKALLENQKKAEQKLAEDMGNRERAIRIAEYANKIRTVQRAKDVELAQKAAAEKSASREDYGISPIDNILSTLGEGIGNIDKNTGRSADKLEATDEDLKYLRDLAEQEVVNRFTTAKISLEMTNHNNINSDLDIDGIVDAMGEKLYEAMEVAAEGVH